MAKLKTGPKSKSQLGGVLGAARVHGKVSQAPGPPAGQF